MGRDICAIEAASIDPSPSSACPASASDSDAESESESVSYSKAFVGGGGGAKRSVSNVGANSEEIDCKRGKMHDLGLPAEGGLCAKQPVFLKEDRQSTDHLNEIEMSQVPPLAEDPETVDPSASGPPPLNSKHCCRNKSTGFGHIKNHNTDDSGMGLDARDASQLLNHNPFYPYKSLRYLKSRDASSECGSSTGPLDQGTAANAKDPHLVWKEMKENGFLSPSHGGIPVPKQRGRKNKKDVLRKNMELAKKEQVDRFTRIAAPSGLLNELNPGIINHVRNSKQVHSILEALVKDDKLENGHVGSKLESRSRSITEKQYIGGRNKDVERENVSAMNSFAAIHEDGASNSLLVNRKKQKAPPSSLMNSLLSSIVGNDGSSSVFEGQNYGKFSCDSHSDHDSEDDKLALKLSSSTTYLWEEDSLNKSSIPSLSVQAATVASQWLGLLYQDMKRRLAALRRSKKRVRAVIQTELPLLVSKEFSSNQENDPSVMQNALYECSHRLAADLHQAKWGALFDQMYIALSEEEKQLESWFNQVKDVRLHCEWGLQHPSWNPPYKVEETRILGKDKDIKLENADNSGKDLAVQAAAASIYSTCNFLLSMENVSCF